MDASVDFELKYADHIGNKQNLNLISCVFTNQYMYNCVVNIFI